MQRAERIAPREVSLDEGLVDDRRARARLARRPGVALVEVSPGDDSDSRGSQRIRG